MSFSGTDWADSTIIESEELNQFFYELMSDEDRNLVLHSYSVKITESGFNYDELVSYLGDTFSDYVFPSEKKQELRDNDKDPGVRALQKAGFTKQYQQDGNLGEFLLFLLTEGYFDMPMISHKIIRKQNYQNEVYGSDNLFFGEFKDREHIGVGEAKVYGRLKQGIKNAVDSITDFHDENSERYMDQELSLAPKNISQNLEPEQIDYLADVMSEDEYSEYPIMHPVFVCYENEELKDVEDITKSSEEIEDDIDEILKQEDYLSAVDEKVDKGHHRLNRAHLLFLFLPVADLDEFRKRALSSIVPGIMPAIEATQESDDSESPQEEVES